MSCVSQTFGPFTYLFDQIIFSFLICTSPVKCFQRSIHFLSVTDTVSELEAAAANAAWQLPFVTLSTAAGTTQNITPVWASASAQAICHRHNGCSKLKCITFLSEQVNESEKCAWSAEEKPLPPVDGGVVKQHASQPAVKNTNVFFI